MDLCLHLIRTDHGAELANHAARRCVVPLFRDGGQAQNIERPVPDDPRNLHSATRQRALQCLDEPLTAPQLAQYAHMSLRTFARRFRAKPASRHGNGSSSSASTAPATCSNPAI